MPPSKSLLTSLSSSLSKIITSYQKYGYFKTLGNSQNWSSVQKMCCNFIRTLETQVFIAVRSLRSVALFLRDYKLKELLPPLCWNNSEISIDNGSVRSVALFLRDNKLKELLPYVEITPKLVFMITVLNC